MDERGGIGGGRRPKEQSAGFWWRSNHRLGYFLGIAISIIIITININIITIFSERLCFILSLFANNVTQQLQNGFGWNLQTTASAHSLSAGPCISHLGLQ